MSSASNTPDYPYPSFLKLLEMIIDPASEINMNSERNPFDIMQDFLNILSDDIDPDKQYPDNMREKANDIGERYQLSESQIHSIMKLEVMLEKAYKIGNEVFEKKIDYNEKPKIQDDGNESNLIPQGVKKENIISPQSPIS